LKEDGFMTISKVIAAIKTDDEFNLSLNSNADTIFHLSPNILKIKKQTTIAHSYGKRIFIHIDLAEGIAKDLYGIKVLKNIGVDGIISTKTNLIKFANEEGLKTIQRFFVIDTRSIDSISESLKQSKANMIEIMPGIVTKIISRLKEKVNVPIIAGGLIETKIEIDEALKAGAYAISTSNIGLWK
jgi:glycerol uptake operon antiterminator